MKRTLFRLVLGRWCIGWCLSGLGGSQRCSPSHHFFSLSSLSSSSLTLMLLLDALCFSASSDVHLPPPLLPLSPHAAHCPSPTPASPPCVASSSSSRWCRVVSWRCCSTASACPACCAILRPPQALGPTTPTKYFILLTPPRPSGASWR